MTTVRRWTALLAVGMTPLLLSCGDARPVTAPAAGTAPQPVPGTLVVALENPEPAGAVLVDLRGEGIERPTAASAATQLLVHAFDAGAGYRVAVIGERLDGPLFTIDVPDIGRTSQYTAVLVQVADQANTLRDDLTGYRLAVRRGTPDLPVDALQE